MIRLRLSQLKPLGEYLTESTLDTTTLETEVRDLDQRVHDLIARHEALSEEFAVEDAKAKAAHGAKSAELKEALVRQKRFRPFEAPNHEWPLWDFERDPQNKKYNPAKIEVYAEVDRLTAELRALRNYANSDAVRHVASKLRDAQTLLTRKKGELRAINDRISAAKASLPQVLVGQTPVMLASLAELDTSQILWDDESEFENWAHLAAVLREESPFECSCNKGYVVGTISVQSTEFNIELDDEIRHSICYWRSRLDFDWLEKALPAKHAHHRLHDLQPWASSPMALIDQEKTIAALPARLENLYGLLMVGPPGTSKTTYAAACIADWLTLRYLDFKADPPRTEQDDWRCESLSTVETMNYWRVKAPAWIREMEAYETRDFDRDDVEPPKITETKIKEHTRRTGYPPILWLEELDKFQPTKNRLRNLYTIVDVVYEAGGVIISTSNETPAELKKLLGGPIYRRLSGECEDEDNYMMMDFFGCINKKLKTVTKAK